MAAQVRGFTGRVVARDAERVTLDLGCGTLTGTSAAPLSNGSAIIALRLDDLEPVEEGVPHLSGLVEAIEFIGRGFHGVARTVNSHVLHFRSDVRLAPGSSVRLGAHPERVLVFPGGAA